MLLAMLLTSSVVATAPAAAPLDLVPYHLTARPWHPSTVDGDAILDAVASLASFAAQHIDEDGAFIDPVLGREFQYATPYMAHAFGALLAAGREGPWSDLGERTMDHATRQVAGGNRAIPDRHGEFYLAPLVEALPYYEDHVDSRTLLEWRRRLRTPVLDIIEAEDMKINNWRTYAMRGEWLRVAPGLADREEAVDFIERAWHHRTQRMRIVPDPWNLYQDWNGHPQSHAVEAVGRVNLLGLVLAGYDGPSAGEMTGAVLRGTETSLLLQDPTGQCPPNGRTDNHVFNDVLYQLAFEAMAEREAAAGNLALAGRYRRAASLAFESIARWKREDAPWEGMCSITKNHLDPADRVGYQPASQVSNYTGATAFHLAEAWHTRRTAIEERPAPAEIGGYLIETGPMFGSVAANAGGMQVFLNVLGDSVAKYGDYWTPLGGMRFSRAGWDSRLGPSDGARDGESGLAAVFGPTWIHRGEWTSLAEMAEHYQGTVLRHFVHPMLVRFEVLYSPVTGVGGPQFYLAFTVTPDGVLATLRSTGRMPFGLTVPLLEDDGRPLETATEGPVLSTRYPDGGDTQAFLVLNGSFETEAEAPVLGSYGSLRPVRITTPDEAVSVFVYPHGPGDPSAEAVLDSFAESEDGFESVLGTAGPTWYRGRHSAGGEVSGLDLNGNGEDDIVFPETTGFVVQREGAAWTRMETDRDTVAEVFSQPHPLARHAPAALDGP